MNRKFSLFITIAVTSFLCVSAIALAEIDSKSSDYFGLNTVKEPYKTRISQALILASKQSSAITASGFNIYTLTDIQKVDYKKQYIWTDSFETRIKTTHFIGTGGMFMNKGDLYLGTKSPMWLVVYRNGDEVKFSVEL